MTWIGGFVLAVLLIVILTTDAAPVTFHPEAKKFNCPPVTADPTPTRLDSLSLDKGEGIVKYILLEPQTTSRTLCTLTRVQDAFKEQIVYIPVARAYDRNPLWGKSAGRYVSTTEVTCGEADADGPSNEYVAGETLCQVRVDPLDLSSDAYYLTTFYVPDHIADEKAIVASFLEKVTFGPTMAEINQLHTSYSQQGPYALASWLHSNLARPIESHRAKFRKHLTPRAVESYIYGIPGPRPCERDARFRRFAFTYMDVEISRGSSSPADNTGAPYTKMKIETVQIDGVPHYVVKFGDHIRTILDSPLQYYSEADRSGPSGDLVTLPDGQYTLCNAEEVVGSQIGATTFEEIGNYAFQILVDATCDSSYTNRGGQDYKGDGAIDSQQIKGTGSTSLARSFDSAQCNLKCGGKTSAKVRYVKGGNPEVNIPPGFDMTTISYLDLTKLSNPSTQLLKLNPDKFHESSWRMTVNLDNSFVSDPPSCTDENGDLIPDPAGQSYNDYFSTGRGKYNPDAPVFAKIPNNKWALYDPRSKFQANTLENPLYDAGGPELKRARRAVNGVPYGDGTPNVDLVTRCSNVEPNIFNEATCQISYDENACETTPTPGSGMSNPTTGFEDANKFLPPYAGRGLVICGSDNEVAPDQTDDDYYAVSNRKLNSHRIGYTNQIRTVWMEKALHGSDQACQKLAWNLSKIFAYSNGHGEEEIYLNTYDWAFVASCGLTYAEVVKRMTHSVQMAEQLTFIRNTAVAYAWHRNVPSKLNFPDENYARENLQLHQIGLTKLHDDGSPMLDRFGKEIPNYYQKHIFAASKIFTGMERSKRRGNYNDLDRTTSSYLDPLVQTSIEKKDWFPKIGMDSTYIGDRYPVCADMSQRPFLQKGAKFVALGGNNIGRYHNDPDSQYLDDEVQKLQLNFEGGEDATGTAFSASPLFDKICSRKQSFQYPTSTLPEGSGLAEYDTSIGAPKCSGRSSRCDSGDLLEGRFPNESPSQNNFPDENSSHNTIDNCEDGIPDSTQLLDGETSAVITESVNRIVVEAVGGTVIRGGSWVNIKAFVYANGSRDKVDYYYAADAANPDWKHITTVTPRFTGNHEITLPRASRDKITFRLPSCDKEDYCDVAFRVAMRSSRVIGSNWQGALWKYTDTQSNDASHRPYNDCADDPYDDTDDIVLQVLPSPRPQDMCDFQGTITLDESLSYCDTSVSAVYKECHVDTARVVELLPGVYYEYVRPPCVNFPFIPESAAAKVIAQSSTAACADKRLPSATSSCCGYTAVGGGGRNTWIDILSEYRNERMTYDGNAARCQDWGQNRNVCDNPPRVAPGNMYSGHCQHHQSCRDSGSGGHGRWLEQVRYHWTIQTCEIKVKIDIEGMVAIVHVPDGTTPALPLVDYDSTVSFFSVLWDESNIAPGRLAYPHKSDNSCDGGVTDDEFCYCSTTVQESVVFSSLPTKTQVLDELHIGAFDPTEIGGYTLTEESDDVQVYTTGGTYALDTIFRVENEYTGGFFYLKNMRSVVSVCNGAYQFRSPPTFWNMVNPDLVSAHHEMDAYLQAVLNHDSAAPFTCKSLIQLYGSSNPSPKHIWSCAQAFKSGTFLFSDPEVAGRTLSFGSGQPSDLHAILASILLSPESYSPAVVMDPASGGVQDAFEKLMHVMRSMELSRTKHHRRSDGFLAGNIVSRIGSGPHGPPDQFSFYSPEFKPPGILVEAGLMSPPAELATLNGIVALSNALYALPRYGLSACIGGVGEGWNRNLYQTCGNVFDGLYTNAAAHLAYSPSGDDSDASKVVGDLSLLLTSNRLSPANRQIIETQFALSHGVSGINEALQVATILTMSTPEFQTTNTVAMSGSARTVTPSTPKNPSVPYKAIVHVNLFGGADTMNMIAPHPDGCQALYDEYKFHRGNENYVDSTKMVKIDASTSEQPCPYFGVNEELNHLAEMYNEGDAIFFANIGHLQKPVNRYTFLAETFAQLFSHHAMKAEMFKVDAFGARLGSGVLGRMADVLSFSMAVEQTGVNKSPTLLKGDPSLANPVKVVTPRGLDPFYYGTEICSEPATELGASCTVGSVHSRRSILMEKVSELNGKTKTTSSLQAEFWSQALIDAIAETDSFRSLLNGACKTQDGNDIFCPASACPNGCKCVSGKCTGGGPNIPDNDLGKPLDIVFRLIALHEARNVNVDLFSVEFGGFDTHFEMVAGLNAKFKIINSALHGFRQDLKNAELDDGTTLWDRVVLVMSSEFGRSISPNTSAGTDHGWSGNAFMAGGKVAGKKILGKHPNTYDPDDIMNTGRGVWIPTTSWEALWYGVTQWIGITDDAAINYVLPNARNFGCNLYSEADLFTDGTATVSGCGGDVITVQQIFLVSEPRVLSPDEQKAYIDLITKTSPVSVRCLIVSQILRVLPAGSRMLNTGNTTYELDVVSEVSFESGEDGETIYTESIDTETFQEEAASVVQMDEVVVEQAEVVVVTSSPSKSPSPSISTKPSYGEDPSLSPSLSTMPSGQPSLSIRPSEAVEIAPYYGYKFVGYGFCLGKVGGNHVFETSEYNYLEFQNALFVAASFCPGACAAYRTHTKYRGFEFETGKCRCLFDGDVDFSTMTHQSAPDVTFDENTAAGIVTDSDGSNDLVRCYKTSLPVASETVDGFEYIGFGNCWDGSMATYDYSAITLPSESNPAAQCGAACSLSNYPQSRGFYTKQGAVCNCLFDADFTDASITITDNGDGTGPIASSNYVEGHCYSALPAPTPKPTKMPTPKPTPRPTNEPTSIPSSIPSNVPSEDPSSNPSLSSGPSQEQSDEPSVSSVPSEEPTSNPSKSYEPSLDPSESVRPSSATDNSLPPSISSAPSSSSGPSLSPSESIMPSDEPSMKPSFRPSDDPSTKPSLVPSDVLSTAPSKSSVPSTEPSTDPSLTPSKSLRPSQAPPRFEMKWTGTLTMQTDVVNAADTLLAVPNFLEKLRLQIKSIYCRDDSNDIFDCEITILTVNGVKVEDLERNRLLRSRRSLADLSDLILDYELIINAICSNQACTDADAVGTQLYTTAKGDLEDALQDGSFVAAVKADISATNEVDTILDNAGITWDFGALVIPLLGLSNLWYPDWHSGEIRCKNDGNAPNYMTLGGWWHESSEEECCKKYFLWAYDVCTGGNAEYLNGYYPAWDASEPRCDTGEPPNYMRSNPEGWLYDTPEECCQRYFGWAPTCVVASGGTAVANPTDSLYYPDWSETNTCVNDGNAPGYMKSNPKIWMYDTLAECCKMNYFWGEEYSKCMASGGSVPAPTEELWYVDYNKQKCVTSCEGSAPCGGLHRSWNIVYSTKAKCCEQHLWWKKDCNQVV